LFASLTSAKDVNEQSLKIGTRAPKFILKDADDKEYNLEKIFEKDKDSPKIIILIIGNHTTRANGNKWARELDKIYKDRKDVGIYMIADLRGLAFFVTESMVKWGTKKENLPITILLDWKGRISEQYKTKKMSANKI
jgi:predicted MPP superfamily phosphohydrolase